MVVDEISMDFGEIHRYSLLSISEVNNDVRDQTYYIFT